MPDLTGTRQSRRDGFIDNGSGTAMQPTPRDEQEFCQTNYQSAEAPGPRRPGTFLLALSLTLSTSNFNVFGLQRKRPQPAAPPEPKKSVQ